MTGKQNMAAKHTPDTIAILDNSGLRGLGDDPLAELRVFAGVGDAAEAQERLDTQIRSEVQAILTATRGCDAFDIIELLRLRELPIVPVVGLREDYDGSGLAIELVALVLLSRGGRFDGDAVGQDAQPHTVIPELHERAVRLGRLANYLGAYRAVQAEMDPLARLANEYQSYLAAVRGLQYESVQMSHDAALFDRPEIATLLRSRLGFTYADFRAVRAAIQERYSRIVTSLRDTTGDIVMRVDADGRDLTADEAETFLASMRDFMFRPATRASFTADDIAAETGLDLSLVRTVLEDFSIDFDGSRDPVAAVHDLLRGVNPLSRTCLMRDDDDHYLMTAMQIGDDSFRVIAEGALKTDAKAWRRYDRTRAEVSETLAVGALERVLQTPATFVNLKYLAPKAGTATDQLAADCPDLYAVADQAECDALFVIGDVAVCVEVKGRTIADPARRGDVARLKTEIDKIFTAGAWQARRLESLISANAGIWLEGATWLDLTQVREIRSIVVGLDFFGPLAVALGDLRRGGALGNGSLPWIASLHDLDVISKVIDRPAEFLLYLRRRTDSEVATYFRGADELDLFMLFMEGGLYIEPDPLEIQRHHPTAGPPKKRDLRRHERDARPTRVGTYTDPLDAWMYFVEGTNPDEVDKPTFNSCPAALAIVDFLADERKPGWFRFGADLLGLSGESQKNLGKALRQLVDMTRGDGRGHSLAQGWAGLWGYPMIFAATAPRNEPHSQSATKLETYMAAKKHQTQSDRSLGLLLDDEGKVVRVVYLNDLPMHDPDLDALGDQIGLMSTEASRRPVPPSARRATRRLRGTHTKAKQRR